MGKVNKIISYQNLTPELLELLNKKYVDGYQNHVMKVQTHGDNFFYGVTIDTPDTSYLIKVPVKIDTNPVEFDDKDITGDTDDDSISGDEEDFSTDDEIEDFDKIADDKDDN